MCEEHGPNHPLFESIARAFVGRLDSSGAVYLVALGFGQKIRHIYLVHCHFLSITQYQSCFRSFTFLYLSVNSFGGIGGCPGYIKSPEIL